MDFNGTIIITDPGYFAKDEDWGNSFDYKKNTINHPSFTNYIWKNTEIGDGSWMVISVDKVMSYLELEDHAKNVFKNQCNLEQNFSIKNKIDYERSIKQDTILGQFGVDSGSFGIFYLDDVLNYYPSFLADLGEWCYTIIPDFKGYVEVVRSTGGSNYEDCREFYILGVGNKTFYSRS